MAITYTYGLINSHVQVTIKKCIKIFDKLVKIYKKYNVMFKETILAIAVNILQSVLSS